MTSPGGGGSQQPGGNGNPDDGKTPGPTTPPASNGPLPTPGPPGPATPSPTGDVTDLSGKSLAALCDKPIAPPARVWRLSQDQIRNSVQATFGVDTSAAQLKAFNDGGGLFFRSEANALRIRKADATSWAVTAGELAQKIVAGLKKGAPCDDLANTACAGKLVDAFGPKLFRRPLKTDERARYVKLFNDALADTTAGANGAAEAVITAFLQSPFFLYRTELGTPVAGKKGLSRLTGYEVAAALSYTFWQTTPDEELMRAAAAGELDKPEGIRAQATRLTKDARFRAFYGQMLADLTRASKMDTRAGAADVPDAAKVMGLLQTELDDYVNAVMADKPTMDELFTRRAVPASGDLAKLRKLTASGAVVNLPSPVAGLLSLGAVSFANASDAHASPVKRGVVVRERLLCSPVPAPPASVKQDFVPSGGDVVTNRQRYEKTMEPAQCNVCHRLFNPMGYAFEAFDEVGQYREQDNGVAVNLSGEIVDTRDANFAFANLSEMAQKLTKTAQAGECFALNAFRFVSGRFEAPGDLCYVKQAYDAFAASGRNLNTLAIELAVSDGFVFRTVDN